MKAFSYARPASLAEAMKLLSPAARPKGGGNDLLDLAKRGVSTPETVVDVRGVFPSDISHGGQFAITASTTLAQIESSQEIRAGCPVVSDAAREASTPQIRTTATLAGNLLQRPRCAYFRDPFFDCLKRGGKTCPAKEGVHDEMAIFGNAKCCAVHPSNLATALVALDARIVIVTRATKEHEGEIRHARAASEFFLPPEKDLTREAQIAPGELIGGVGFDRAPASAYVEINQKQSYDWASVACAAVLEVVGGKIGAARIALGAVAPVPILSEAAGAALAGKSVGDTAAWDKAAAAACEGATPLRDNRHKVRQLRTVVRRAIEAAAARAK